jgi:serine protease Do
MSPGTAVKIDILRNGSERTASVTLGEIPVTPFKVAAAPTQPVRTELGLGLAPSATIEGAGRRGVVITEVDPNGLAAEKGLAAGDIILDVSGKPVTTSADVHNALSRAQESGKHDILMRIKTKDGGIRFVALRPLPLGNGPSGAGSAAGSIRSDR